MLRNREKEGKKKKKKLGFYPVAVALFANLFSQIGCLYNDKNGYQTGEEFPLGSDRKTA